MQHKFSFFLRKIPGIEEYLSEIENTIPILTYTGNNWQTYCPLKWTRSCFIAPPRLLDFFWNFGFSIKMLLMHHHWSNTYRT